MTVGCMKQLPPAPIPEPIAAPVAEAAAPREGHGRLIVDVVDGPAPVARVRMEARPSPNPQGLPTVRFTQTPTELCPAAPCITELPFGNILIGFPVVGDHGALETELVNIGPEPSVYRRSLSVYTDNTGATRILGILATSLGAASAITGTALLPIGLSKGNDGMTLAGGVTLGGGLAAVVIGILMIRADSPTFRPGSSTTTPS
jgi:hypothetical protein